MANKYKDKFYNIIDSKRGYKYFTPYYFEMEEGKRWYISRFNIDQDLFNLAVELAKEKASHTMNNNQNLQERSEEEKIAKQTQGILAEMAVHIFLEQRLGFKVKRFDLERDSFDYQRGEYDLQLAENNAKIEVRSSNAHGIEVHDYVREKYIIGPYHNKSKEGERYSDFYFRPVFFDDFTMSGDQPWKNFQLFLLGGATKKDMKEKSYIDNLGQKNTEYRVIKFKDAGDLKYIKERIEEALMSSENQIQ